MENYNNKYSNKDKNYNKKGKDGNDKYNNKSNKDKSYDKTRNFEPKKNKAFDLMKNKPFPFSHRVWVPNVDLEKSEEYVRVISYNILCDSLITVSTEIDESQHEKFPFFKWENRRRGILAELKELDGDIICLQEFERDEIFIEEMGKMGYDV